MDGVDGHGKERLKAEFRRLKHYDKYMKTLKLLTAFLLLAGKVRIYESSC
jgi:hypothetical protein